MNVTGIEHRECPDWYGADPLESLLAAQRVLRGIGHREREVRRALLDELQVVHGRRGDFRCCLNARQVLADYLGDAAAVRVEHSARAASRNRQSLCAWRRRGSAGARRDRECDQRRRCKTNEVHGENYTGFR